jgi:hypothetical protein
MRAVALSSSKPPEPAPITGNATERNCLSSTIFIADNTDPRIDFSDARQSMLMPAT